MMDDELTRVPKSVEPWRVVEFLRELGITPEDVCETTIGIRQVVVWMYATDEAGHRYAGEDGKSAAEHVVSIPMVGSWKKPSEPEDCPAWVRRGDERVQCALPMGHDEEHSFRLHTGRILGDVPQA